MAKLPKSLPRPVKRIGKKINAKLAFKFFIEQEQLLSSWQNEGQSVATRKASMQWLEASIDTLPELLGGSADLSCSNLTQVSQRNFCKVQTSRGNYLGYGVREFGMAAIMNGLALYGGFILMEVHSLSSRLCKEMPSAQRPHAPKSHLRFHP